MKTCNAMPGFWRLSHHHMSSSRLMEPQPYNRTAWDTCGLSLGPPLFAACSFPWWMFYIQGISKHPGSLVWARLYHHSFTGLLSESLQGHYYYILNDLIRRRRNLGPTLHDLVTFAFFMPAKPVTAWMMPSPVSILKCYHNSCGIGEAMFLKLGNHFPRWLWLHRVSYSISVLFCLLV